MIPLWLSAIWFAVKEWLGFRAKQKQDQAEHTGEVIQQNADLKAQLAADEAALKAEANAPASKEDKLKALEEGQA